MTGLLLASTALPLALALAVTVAAPLRIRVLALRLAPWAPLPALLTAVLADPQPAEAVPWLLLDTRLGLDATGQVFLFVTAALWLAAGVYARAYHAHDPARPRFVACFLLTMAGNLGLVVAHDLVTFYVAFALMTFGAYPLVAHQGDPAALRAGWVYIVMAVVGETMLLAGFILAVASAPDLSLGGVAAGVAASPNRDVAVALLLAGFGVKAGALPLHVWLPLAHPVAPTPASAVLSGSMIKAGLLGWIRFLPLGEMAMPGWGTLVIGVGLAAAFFGVLIGALQDDPKTALAYSSISQMGIVNVAIGIGLTNPAAWPAALGACLVYVVHHGLAKAALFLGVGVAAAAHGGPTAWRLSLAALALAGLAVAGAPLSSGMVAKTYVKEIAPFAPAAWPDRLDLLLPLTAVGTTLLIGRFLVLVARRGGRDAHVRLTPGLWLPWAALLGGVAAIVWFVPGYYELDVDPPGMPYPGAVWVAIWPIVAGLIVLAGGLTGSRRWPALRDRLRVAPGDLLVPAEHVLRRMAGAWARFRAYDPQNPVSVLSALWYSVYKHGDEPSAVIDAERRLTRWFTAGVLSVVLFSAFLALLALR